MTTTRKKQTDFLFALYVQFHPLTRDFSCLSTFFFDKEEEEGKSFVSHHFSFESIQVRLRGGVRVLMYAKAELSS
jgi:hypothetical protein